VARNFFCSSRSFGDKGYTRQLMEAGASGLRSIAWSHGRRSGNFSESFSRKTRAWRWYCFGISSCHGLSSFCSFTSMASCCATVLLRMNCSQTSSPGDHSGIARTQAGVFCCTRGVPRFGGCHLSASSVDRVVVSANVASAQLTTGAQAARNGYPKIKSSGPMSATKNIWRVTIPRCFVIRVTASSNFPALFSVPSTFRTLRGVASLCVTIPRCFTVRGWIKHSVAPLSSSAF